MSSLVVVSGDTEYNTPHRSLFPIFGKPQSAESCVGRCGYCLVSRAALADDAQRMQLTVRSVRIADRDNVRAFLSRLSPDTVRARYLYGVPLTGAPLDREVARLVDPHQPNHAVLVAVTRQILCGIAEYVRESAGRAEIAVVVEDAFQGQGIGTALMRNLAERAAANDIQTFTGEVAPDNQRVLAMLRRSRRLIQLQHGYASHQFGVRLAMPELHVA